MVALLFQLVLRRDEGMKEGISLDYEEEEENKLGEIPNNKKLACWRPLGGSLSTTRAKIWKLFCQEKAWQSCILDCITQNSPDSTWSPHSSEIMWSIQMLGRSRARSRQSHHQSLPLCFLFSVTSSSSPSLPQHTLRYWNIYCNYRIPNQQCHDHCR